MLSVLVVALFGVSASFLPISSKAKALVIYGANLVLWVITIIQILRLKKYLHRVSKEIGDAWTLIAFSLIFWLLGIFILLFRTSLPQPLNIILAASIFFLLFFPLLFVGVLKLFIRLISRQLFIRLIFDWLLIVLAAIVIQWDISIRRILDFSNGFDFNSNFNLLFSSLNILMVLVMSIAFYSYDKRPYIKKSRAFLAIFLILLVVGNVFIMDEVLRFSRLGVVLIGLVYMAAILCLTVSYTYQHEEITYPEEEKSKRVYKWYVAVITAIQTWVPYILTLWALGILINMNLQDGIGKFYFAAYLASTGAFIIIRQHLIVADNERLISNVTNANELLELQKKELLESIDQLTNEIRERERIQNLLKQSEQTLQRSTSHDPLTGLPNRSRLMNDLEVLMDIKNHESQPFGLLFLDFNNFKNINDLMGHSIGDSILLKIARRLERASGASSTVYRVGGDEFVIITREEPILRAAIDTSKKIQSAIQHSFTEGNQKVFVSASIGIVQFDSSYTKPSELLTDGELAMYNARKRGFSQTAVFDTDMRSMIIRRSQIENDIRAALQAEEFFVEYQPLIDIKMQTIFGFEALTRWKHPTLGYIPPMDFIPIAEKSGTISPLTYWLLKQVAEQLLQWKNKANGQFDLSVTVNIPLSVILDPQFVNELVKIREDYQLEPYQIRIEITESMFAENPEAVHAQLGKLIEKKIPILMDDFGTGYSSLSSLRNYPLRVLKIDRSFILGLPHDARSVEIVKSIIKMANELDIKVIAEGVENHEQLKTLGLLGCQGIQGYVFSRPLPGNEAFAWQEEFKANKKQIFDDIVHFVEA